MSDTVFMGTVVHTPSTASDIQIFDNAEFGRVRTHEDERGVVTFCAKDVAAALGYKNTSKAVNDHCHGVTIRYPIPDQLGRRQKTRFITEPDVYRLISHSKLPSAQLFEAWVFEEVLPAIRHHGGYVGTAPGESDEQIMARALVVANAAIERNHVEIDRLKPRAALGDALMGSDGTCCIREAVRYIAPMNDAIRLRDVLEDLKACGMLCKGPGSTPPTRAGIDT
ncbi:MAG: BRO family protein, partial [Gordonibacter sp.]